MKLIRNRILFLLFISFSFSLEYTEYGFEIFSLPGDAKTQSLGGASNINSMSLVDLYTLDNYHRKGKSLFSYAKLYNDIIDYFQFSYILSSYDKSKIGISLLNKNISNISNTQLAWEDLGFNISQNDIDYDKITTYKDIQISLIFFYSYNASFGNIGLKVKPIYTSLLSEKAYGVSADIGFNKKYMNKIYYGFMINDIMSFYKWNNNQTYFIYPKLNSSFSYILNKSSLYTEISISTNPKSINPYTYRVGYQYLMNNTLSIRLGYSNIKSFSIGAGFIYKDIEYSYSFNANLNDIILGHDHQFSILLDLEKNKSN